jgi:hypothetical protein
LNIVRQNLPPPVILARSFKGKHTKTLAAAAFSSSGNICRSPSRCAHKTGSNDQADSYRR